MPSCTCVWQARQVFSSFLPFDAVDGCAGAAETVTAAAASFQRITGIFHSGHNREVCRDAVLLTEKIYIYHIFHVTPTPFLILVRQLVDLVAAEHRAVLADVLGTDVAAAAFADAALHAQLQRGVDLFFREAHFNQRC